MIDAALAKHLDSIDLVTYDPDGPDGDCFTGTMPSAPDEAVMIKVTGGFPQPTKEPDDLPTVQVIVRGPRQGVREAAIRALVIYGACACLDGVTLDEGGDDEVRVIGLTPLQSHPIDMGRDDNQRHELSLNFVAHIHAPTANRV